MLEINENYAVGADELNVTLYYKTKQRGKRTGGTWRAISFYPDIHTAISGLIKREILGTGLDSLKAIDDKMAELNELVKAIPNISVTDVIEFNNKGRKKKNGES